MHENEMLKILEKLRDDQRDAFTLQDEAFTRMIVRVKREQEKMMKNMEVEHGSRR